MDEKDFMQEAIEISRTSVHSEQGGPFGAVVVKDGYVVGRGSNKVTKANDPTAHAEVTAIRDACENLDTYNLSGCTIYSSCEPCPMCLSAIYWARIDKIYYANTQQDAANINFDDEFLYKQLALPKEQRSLKAEQIMREEALGVFEEWAKKEDKTSY